jgi:hypothetical protein
MLFGAQLQKTIIRDLLANAAAIHAAQIGQEIDPEGFRQE